MEAQQILDLVLLGVHWPLFFCAAVLWALGRMFKSVTTAYRRGRFWRLFHATMTYHPIAAGALFGALPGAPAPDAVRAAGWLACVLYFAGSGFVASFGVKGYRAFKAARSKE